MERPFLHRKCSSVSSTSWPWPSVLQWPSFLSHYTCSSRLGLELIGNRFPASQPPSSPGSRGALRLVYSDAWPQFTQCTCYGRIYSVSFVPVLATTGTQVRRDRADEAPSPSFSQSYDGLRWAAARPCELRDRCSRCQHPIQPTATPQFMGRPQGGVLQTPLRHTRLGTKRMDSMVLSIFFFYLTVFTTGLRTGC